MAPPIKDGRAKFPSMKGRLMVDTINGKVRVRAWPKPRGKNVPEQVKIQNDRFRDAQRLSVTCDPWLQNRAKEATAHTGLYPRDILTKFMLAAPFTFEQTDGTLVQHGRHQVWSIMFQGFRLQLTANQGFGASTVTYPTWPSPVVDSSGFFNAAQPDRITIPDHVDGMIFFGGWRRTAIAADFSSAGLQKITGGAMTLCENAQYHTAGPIWCSGPIPVTPGEQYAAYAYEAGGGTMLADRTFFSGIIISTDF